MAANRYHEEVDYKKQTSVLVSMMRVGFEPTPVRTRLQKISLVWRLRPLGHLTISLDPSWRLWAAL